MGHFLKKRSGKENSNRDEDQSERTFEALKLTMFASFSDPSFQEIDKEQFGQVLRAFLTVATYANKEPRMRKFFCSIFHAGQSSVALINRGHFLQNFLYNARHGAIATLDITTLSVLYVNMLSHRIATIE